MRPPSPGRSASPAVRTVMSDEPLFCGSVKLPVKTAPRASEIVSPGCALFSALCRSPPAATEIVDAVEIDAQRNTPAHTRRAVLMCFILNFSGSDRGSSHGLDATLTDLPRQNVSHHIP